MTEKENSEQAAKRASEAAFELEISNETREFLHQLPDEEARKSNIRPLYWMGAAASILILIASVLTINLTHNDERIAGKYGINAIVARSGNNVTNDDFREAVKAYYAEDYDSSLSILNQIDEEGKINDYKDWLELLITMQRSGSKSQEFKNQLNAILANDSHEFYYQAEQLQSDLDLFWRNFVLQ